MFRAAFQTSECVCLHCPVRKLSICAALHGAELITLSNLRPTVHYKQNMTLVDQDEPAEAVHIVTEGVVRLHTLLPDGRRQVVGFALPGDFLGYIVGDIYTCSAVALGEVTTCRFSRKIFDEILDKMPHLLRSMYAAVARELSFAQRHMMLLGHYSAQEKLTAFLIQMHDRWQRVNGASTHVPLPMLQQDIADYLGLTVETVCRMLRQMARQKLVAIDRNDVHILDMGRLAKVAP